MKLLIVRHGDPNYAIDGLTEKGQREAQLLADRLCKEPITALYCSPLGRAKLTAEPTRQRLGLEAHDCDWLREFESGHITVPHRGSEGHCWDLLPAFMSENPTLFSDRWREHPMIAAGNAAEAYDAVCAAFDAVLAQHGYRRCGVNYTVERANHEVLLFVCHYGVSCVLLSHLMNCSPYSLWQNACTLPTSVTTFCTEERRQGVASLRCLGLGDVSHLYAAGEEPAFSARFCECFTDGTRHD